MSSGLVFCADCDKTMVLHRAHTMKPSQNNFACATYKKKGKEICTAHYIREEQLRDIILEDLCRTLWFARTKEEEFAEIIGRKNSAETRREIKKHRTELDTMRRRESELNSIFKRLYKKTSSEWVRYSKYDYKETGGKEYLTPAADSDITIYNPLEVAEKLVVDALNRGALLCQGETITDKEKAALLDFTGRYGLLGFMAAIPLNGGFMGCPHVFLGRNGFLMRTTWRRKSICKFFSRLAVNKDNSKLALPCRPRL